MLTIKIGNKKIKLLKAKVKIKSVRGIGYKLEKED